MSVSPVGCPGPPRRWSRHSSDALSWCQSKPLQRRKQAAAQEPAANHWADKTRVEEEEEEMRKVKRWAQSWGQRGNRDMGWNQMVMAGKKTERLVHIPTWVTSDSSMPHVLTAPQGDSSWAGLSLTQQNRFRKLSVCLNMTTPPSFDASKLRYIIYYKYLLAKNEREQSIVSQCQRRANNRKSILAVLYVKIRHLLCYCHYSSYLTTLMIWSEVGL